MKDFEKRLEQRIFQYLSDAEDITRESSLNVMYNDLFKSNGLLSSEAFDQGRLIRNDDLRNMVRRMHSEGLVTQREHYSEVYFRLSDAGIVELNRRQSEELDFTLPVQDAETRRWQRLKQTKIDLQNVESVAELINKSLEELSKVDLTNEEHRQAAAYLLAARELVVAPAPPSEIIWDLVQKAAAIAGIAQAVLLIFSVLD